MMYNRGAMTADYKKAQQAATTLLEKYNVTEPTVSVVTIAESEGLSIKVVAMPDTLKDVSGFVDFENKLLFVNASDPPRRQAFTIAHELGHWTLHKDKAKDVKVLPRFAGTSAKDPIEQEANCFAAHLLVPLDMLKDTMKKNKLTKSEIPALAYLFGVSNDVIRFQLLRI